MDELIESVLARLRHGLAAQLEVQGIDKQFHRIVFVPANVYMDQPGKPELMIALEGKGVFFYDLQTPLNTFQLISKGFPILIANQVVRLVKTLLEEGRKTRPQSLAQEHVKALPGISTN